MGNKQSNSRKKYQYPIPPNAVRPSAPGQPQIEIEDESSVFVQWEPPEDCGGCPVIGYLVQHSELNERQWHTPNPPMMETHCWIINLTPGATYVFRVIAENILGYSAPSILSEETQLSTEFSPPKFVQELESVNALQHERVEFRARLAPGPPCQITWFMDNSEIFAGEIQGVEIGGNSLVLRSVDTDCEVKCLVESEYGAAESVALLTVGVPPRIKEEPHLEHFFRVGEIIRIKFNFSGKPAPSVHWFHDQKPITQFQALSNTTILKISNAARHHRGEYTVKVENVHGQDSCFALVTVADRPSPPSKPTVALMSDNSCLLEWEDGEDDGGCPVTSHAVEYYRAGWDVWLAGTSTRSRNAKIKDLIPGSTYVFRVKAENPYGTSEPSASSPQIFIPDLSSGLMTTVDEMEEEQEVKSPEQPSSFTPQQPNPISISPRLLQKDRDPHQKYTTLSTSSNPNSPARSRTPEAPNAYKPPALLDHYASARSLTLPRSSASANPLDRHYYSSSTSSLTGIRGQGSRGDESPSPSTPFSPIIGSGTGVRSQSSLDSCRSPSAASSSSHLIFEEDSEEETGLQEPQTITTSSLTLFKTGQNRVRVKTSTSREELMANSSSRGSSRDVSPSPVIPPPVPLGLGNFWTLRSTLLQKEAASSELKKEILVKTPITPSTPTLEKTNDSSALQGWWWDWAFIPLLLVAFVKYLNLGASVAFVLFLLVHLFKLCYWGSEPPKSTE